MLVFTLGIKAVGKSHVIRELNKPLQNAIREISYGDVMLEIAKEKEGISDREQIAALPPEIQVRIREEASKRIRALADKEKLVFLNTHGFIYTIPHHAYLPGSPDSVSDVLKPDFVFLVEASPKAISERREKDLKAGRKREMNSRKEIEEALFCERIAALHVGMRYACNVKFFDNSLSVEKNAGELQRLAELFKSLKA
ncbi:AAA family ATPase [Candidatus Micrarchaeota archaeon]|nr:AAA family ATPase [Candidatus Micrarchaeota archaeon]